MKVAGKGAILIGAEGRKSPPLPFLEVDDNEGAALIRLGIAVEVTDVEDAPNEEPTQPPADESTQPPADPAEEAKADDQVEEPEAETETETETETEVEAETPKTEGDTDGDGHDDATGEFAEGNHEAADANESTDDEAAKRAETIADALDLVEEAGLVKTGARAGKPKVAAIEDITGLTDVTVEEIDAAVAAKTAA